MDRIEQLELMVAELKAEVAYLKSQIYNTNTCSETIHYEPVEHSYREEQQRWRDAGWNAYNSDYVDEFPTW